MFELAQYMKCSEIMCVYSHVAGTTKSAEAGQKRQTVHVFYTSPLEQLAVFGTQDVVNYTLIMAVGKQTSEARFETVADRSVAPEAIVILVASMSISQPKLMHLAEARLFTILFLAGASLLMSFHLGSHCRPGYDVTHSSFLAGCTRRLPGILAYHYHAHHPAAWSKISKYISNCPLVLSVHSWPRVEQETSCTIKVSVTTTTRSAADITTAH